MANLNADVLVRVQLNAKSRNVLKRLNRAIRTAGSLAEDMPWKEPEVRALKMDLEYVVKNLSVERE